MVRLDSKALRMLNGASQLDGSCHGSVQDDMVQSLDDVLLAESF